MVDNKKGQALIESTGLLIMTGLFLYILLRLLIGLILLVSLDAMAEDFFICRLENKTDCSQKLETRLNQSKMRDIVIRPEEFGTKIKLTINATHFTSMTITREFEYEKFREEF